MDPGFFIYRGCSVVMGPFSVAYAFVSATEKGPILTEHSVYIRILFIPLVPHIRIYFCSRVKGNCVIITLPSF